MTAFDWSLSDRLPERAAASCLYDSGGRLRAWETRHRAAYLTRLRQHRAGRRGRSSVVPLNGVTMSPFWHGYEVQVGLVGSVRQTSNLRRVPVLHVHQARSGAVALARGAYTTAMEWIEAGEAEYQRGRVGSVALGVWVVRF